MKSNSKSRQNVRLTGDIGAQQALDCCSWYEPERLKLSVDIIDILVELQERKYINTSLLSRPTPLVRIGTCILGNFNI